jgi:hypothetical protein
LENTNILEENKEVQVAFTKAWEEVAALRLENSHLSRTRDKKTADKATLEAENDRLKSETSRPVAMSLGRVALFGIFDPFEILQGLCPYRWGVSPYLGSLILSKYFKVHGHIAGACRPIWDL